MNKGRLEAFTDGVIAIIITIMVLELKVPHGDDWSALAPLWPKFLSYVLSFVYVGIYWNNHHHTMQVVRSVSGSVLWSNLFLLFALSLLPLTTAWMGENHFAARPVLLYGANLFLAACAYWVWAQRLIAHHGRDSALAHAFGADRKGRLSIALYVAGIALTFVAPWLGVLLYALVAAMWLVPDRRMERALGRSAP